MLNILILDNHPNFTISPELIHDVLHYFDANYLLGIVFKAKILNHLFDLIKLVHFFLAAVELVIVIINF